MNPLNKTSFFNELKKCKKFKPIVFLKFKGIRHLPYFYWAVEDVLECFDEEK